MDETELQGMCSKQEVVGLSSTRSTLFAGAEDATRVWIWICLTLVGFNPCGTGVWVNRERMRDGQTSMQQRQYSSVRA